MQRIAVLGTRRLAADFLGVLIRRRQLLWEMTRRDLTDRYVGQVFGQLWTVGHPLLLVAVYVFLFAWVLKIKIPDGTGLPLDYTGYLLAGLLPWLTVQESLMKSTTAIVSQSSLVKQVVFPLEVLPVKGVLSSMCTQVIFLAILAVYTIAQLGTLPWTYVLLPALLGMQLVGLVGAGLLLSSIGVFFRDLKDFTQVFCMMGIYLMPVCYLPEMVPELLQPLLFLNPFSYLTWCFQDVCYHGAVTRPWAWLVVLVLSTLAFAAGARFFRFLRPMFGNVL